MKDDKTKQGYQDDAKIDSKDRSELAYRSKAWKYTIGAILVAIHATKSNSAKIVKKWLDANWLRIKRSKV